MNHTTTSNPLRDYLDRHQVELGAFAEQIGEDYQAVRRNSLPLDHPQFVVPRGERMAKIVSATQGEVQPNQFYGLPPAADATAAPEA